MKMKAQKRKHTRRRKEHKIDILSSISEITVNINIPVKKQISD